MRSLVGLLFVVGACGTSPTAAPLAEDVATATDASVDSGADAPLDTSPEDVAAIVDVPPDTALPPYPSGPYGSAVGQTVADLRWEGYVNDAHEETSTALTFGPTRMEAVRATGAPFALVHLSGFL